MKTYISPTGAKFTVITHFEFTGFVEVQSNYGKLIVTQEFLNSLKPC